MILKLSPADLLSLYKTVITSTSAFVPTDDSVKQIERVLLESLESIEAVKNIKVFKDWTSSEQNKIKLLNDELNKLSDIPKGKEKSKVLKTRTKKSHSSLEKLNKR